MTSTVLPCSACHHGTLPTYTRTAATFTSDGLGPTVDAPCLRCRGTGSEPCALCGDQPATSELDGIPVCADCRETEQCEATSSGVRCDCRVTARTDDGHGFCARHIVRARRTRDEETPEGHRAWLPAPAGEERAS